mmetsp:Transcript_33207/g.30147  ORF Transcript_33207/g.30147 Transcript_33207/m.30147 type:complete len:102 (+) Transcript_33207:540-845(+)
MRKSETYAGPQSTIIDTVMNNTARKNPFGVVGDYIRLKKEAEVMEKRRKRSSRPSTASLQNLGENRQAIGSAKKVGEFFRNFKDHEEGLREMIYNPIIEEN